MCWFKRFLFTDSTAKTAGKKLPYPVEVYPVWTRGSVCLDGSSSPPPALPSEGCLSLSEKEQEVLKRTLRNPTHKKHFYCDNNNDDDDLVCKYERALGVVTGVRWDSPDQLQHWSDAWWWRRWDAMSCVEENWFNCVLTVSSLSFNIQSHSQMSETYCYVNYYLTGWQ